MKVFLVSFIVFLLAGATGLAGLLRVGGRDLPSPAHLQAITHATKTRVLDREGRLIGEFFKEDRSLVRLDEVPENLVNAFVAVEDRRFWEHWGISPPSILRAGLKNVASMRVREGASTITQQLARNLFLTHERSINRKLKEAVLALRIEQNYSKDEILEMYLNQIYFGDGAYGVKAAARQFLGKDLNELTLPECALLAGLPRNPRGYSPRRNPKAAHKRRQVVLGTMLDAGYISRDQLQGAYAESLDVSTTPLSPETAPYFLEMVRMFLEQEYGAQAIYEDGLTVYTTLDLPLQRKMAHEVESQVAKLEEIVKAEHTRDEHLTLVEQGESPTTRYLQAASLVVDAKTGSILALMGGRSFAESEFNRVTSARRQPGSAFKPFIFLAALQNGFYPSYTVMDAPISFEQLNKPDEPWEPKNYDLKFHGPVTLRYALQKSLNIPTIKIQEEIGTRAVIQAARAAGIESRIPAVRSIALGTAEVTLEELTYAYTVFANNGIRVEPQFITRIEDRNGNTLQEFRPSRREVLPAAPVEVLNDMLTSVMDRGTGAGARLMGFELPAAGKTGTTDDYSDAWFVGYTPEIVTGVWVGYDQPQPIGKGMSGSQAALPIWARVMKAATEDRSPIPFEHSEQIVQLVVCSETGLPATPACPATAKEIFLAGYVPAETCYLHSSSFDLRLRDRWLNLRDGDGDRDVNPDEREKNRRRWRP